MRGPAGRARGVDVKGMSARLLARLMPRGAGNDAGAGTGAPRTQVSRAST
ncbi:hypothetical protein L810_3684 [Burkholderia sp. AU4i]|nr:hypothetical protein L810_3684 [Burkholderia sp. AU4i]